jgi:TRAP-type C4-dicarboxylate transport system substrate-binding protein
MNLARFNGLSKAQQDVIMQAAKAAGEVMRDGAAQANADAIAVMQKSGVKISRPDKADFTATVQPVHTYFSAMIGQDLIEEVKAAQK